jgi:hypothetical protein
VLWRFNFRTGLWDERPPLWSWWQHLWPNDPPGTDLNYYNRCDAALKKVIEPEPIEWDFGSAAVHHRLYCDWMPPENFRAGMLGMRGTVPPAHGLMKAHAKEIAGLLKEAGVADMPLGIDLVLRQVKASRQRRVRTQLAALVHRPHLVPKPHLRCGPTAGRTRRRGAHRRPQSRLRRTREASLDASDHLDLVSPCRRGARARHERGHPHERHERCAHGRCSHIEPATRQREVGPIGVEVADTITPCSSITRSRRTR